MRSSYSELELGKLRDGRPKELEGSQGKERYRIRDTGENKVLIDDEEGGDDDDEGFR